MTSWVPEVSIIMAARNTAPFLKDCLDSIIAQSFTSWELIAVNDHSNDLTPNILNEYSEKDDRVRFFNSSREKLIPTLKEGYSHIRGALVNRMDSDDIMPTYKLEVLVDEWKKHGKGTVIAGGTQHFVEKGEVGGGFRRYEEWLNNVAAKSTHKEEIYKECVIPSHSWIIHKDDLDRVGAFEPEIYPEDYDLCFRFYEYGLNIVGLDKILHYWRDRSERISRTWDCYKDNRYFDLKLGYFYKLDRDFNRPLVLWGAGKNGKDMAKLIQEKGDNFHWVCDSVNKIGHNVNGVIMQHFEKILKLNNPQIMIVVSSPSGKKAIEDQLNIWGKKPILDFWFFL